MKTRSLESLPLGLDAREAAVLREVIHTFIVTAKPVGSRTLSKIPDMDLSPATIRNVMADLEERGWPILIPALGVFPPIWATGSMSTT